MEMGCRGIGKSVKRGLSQQQGTEDEQFSRRNGTHESWIIGGNRRLTSEINRVPRSGICTLFSPSLQVRSDVRSLLYSPPYCQDRKRIFSSEKKVAPNVFCMQVRPSGAFPSSGGQGSGTFRACTNHRLMKLIRNVKSCFVFAPIASLFLSLQVPFCLLRGKS